MGYIEYKDSRFSWHGLKTEPTDLDSPDYYLVNGIKYYSESILKKLGFRAKHLRSLGSPDLFLPNRRFPGSSEMKLHEATKTDTLFPF